MDTYKITDLKQGVRNPDRVNVYVDSKFSFSLDISQVVDFGIKVGLEISDSDLADVQKKNVEIICIKNSESLLLILSSV